MSFCSIIDLYVEMFAWAKFTLDFYFTKRCNSNLQMKTFQFMCLTEKDECLCKINPPHEWFSKHWITKFTPEINHSILFSYHHDEIDGLGRHFFYLSRYFIFNCGGYISYMYNKAWEWKIYRFSFSCPWVTIFLHSRELN
jgi:hypothetical protein